MVDNIELTFGSIIPTILDEVKKSNSLAGQNKSSIGTVSSNIVVRNGYALTLHVICGRVE